MKRILMFVLLQCLVSAAWAQLSPDQVQQLEQSKGQRFRMRYLLSDSKIRYDANGNLVGKWHAGRWTSDSNIEVVKIEAKDKMLRVNAYRLLLNYNRGTHLFQAFRSGEVNIEIETSRDASGKIDIAKELEKAFLDPNEDYPLEMQPYWKPFISCLINPKTAECEYYEKESGRPDVYNAKPTTPTWKPSYPGVYEVGRATGITAPKVRSKVEPVYTEIARKARIEGTVLLEGIVTKQGTISIQRIVRPLGYGLEESAAEALSQWTFEPANRNGQAVDVRLNIEINFNLRR
jgi:TonB family protein